MNGKGVALCTVEVSLHSSLGYSNATSNRMSRSFRSDGDTADTTEDHEYWRGYSPGSQEFERILGGKEINLTDGTEEVEPMCDEMEERRTLPYPEGD